MKSFIGKVVSNKMTKTAVVAVDWLLEHPKYGKMAHRTTKFSVHDEVGVKTGDVVRAVEVKPMSKNKQHKIVEVIKK